MRISASLGAIVATGLLGHSSAQAADYGPPGGSPNGVPSDAAGNVPPVNSNGSPGTFPAPGTVPGSIPGTVPGGIPPIGPVIPAGSIPGSVTPGGVIPVGSVVPAGSIPGDGSVIVPGSLPYPNGVPPVVPGSLPYPGGFPPVVPGSLPYPGGAPTVLPAGGVPSGIPGDGSVIVPGSLPYPDGVSGAPGASIPSFPTCATKTTTVIVTVYPTNSDGTSDGPPNGFPDGPEGGSQDGSSDGSPDDSFPNDSDPDQTATQSPVPTQPPSFTANPANPAVSPFITLTIDIWGSPDDEGGFDDGTGTGDGADPGSDDTGAVDDNASDDGTNPSDGSGTSDGNAPGDGTTPGDGPGSSDGSDSPFPPIPAPDTAPEYSSDGSGGFPTDSSGSLTGGPGASTQATGPGSPGSTPIIPPFIPSGDSGQQLSDSLPVSTQGGSQAPAGVSPWFTNAPGTVGNGPMPTPWVTITGADGLPTIINGGGGLPAATITGADGLPTIVNGGSGVPVFTITGIDGLPTIINGGSGVPGAGVTVTGADGLPTIINSGSGVPVFTITGADGLPTIINGGSGVPAVTITGADGLPTIVNGGSGVPVFTITGMDGLPTIINGGGSVSGAPGLPPSASSGVFPTGNDQGPQGISTGLPLPPPVITGAPGGSVPQAPSDGSGFPFPGDDSANGITTCAEVTIVGSDGLPTVVDSTWVIPASAPATGASAQLPVTALTQGSDGLPVTGDPQGGSGDSGLTTSTSYTVIGTDGLPTVVQSTWVVPNPTPVSILTQAPGIPSSDPNGIPGGIPGGIPTVSGNQGGGAPITTCTSYTVIGTDGLPTVVDSTWVVPGPVSTLAPFPGSPGIPSGASSALPNGIPPAVTGFPSSLGPAGSGAPGGGIAITTCTSYTVIGSDGLPTVVDSTWVIPGAVDTQGSLPGNPSFVSGAFPSGLPTGIPGQITGSPELPSPGDSGVGGGVTTCVTYTVIGTDGLPTVVDSTWVVPTESALPTGTSFGFPPGSPQNTITGIPLSFTSDVAAGQFTVLTTAVIVGPDGQPTPVVQTVVLTSVSDLGLPTGAPQGTVSGIPAPPPSGPFMSSGDANPLSTAYPSLSEYGAASLSPIVGGSSADAQGTFVSGTVTGTLTSTMTQVVDSTGGPIISGGTAEPPLSYDPSGTGAPISDVGYGPVPSEITLWPQASNLQTSIWTNVIEEPTTTYTIKFPLTTMATITVPAGSSAGRRVVRRQDSSEPSFSAWTNSSSSSLSSTMTTADTFSTLSVTSSATSSAPTMCSTGGRIGNTTIDFDTSMPGPLFNPLEAIWFSEGFHIAPPSSQSVQPYIPSSGGQLVEFVPPSLTNTTTGGSGDVAEIGMGPHSPSPCFRFDFFGARVGCETEGNEEWCEFEISAYRYNDTSSSEESIAWSEVKQVPACSTFLEGGYELTPIELEGYNDLSSVLITVRVGLELRSWWGDDFRVGWTDNSCVAEACRSNSPHLSAKRETVESALRRGIWGWSPSGFERLDDALVWESMN